MVQSKALVTVGEVRQATLCHLMNIADDVNVRPETRIHACVLLRQWTNELNDSDVLAEVKVTIAEAEEANE